MPIRKGLVATAALLVAAPAAGAAVPCGPSRAQTLASDQTARVYMSGDRVLGCAAGGRQSYLLGSSRPTGGHQVGPVALAGDVAAYGLTQSGVDTISATVVVRGLRNGTKLRDYAATSRPVGPESVESVGSVVVRSDAAVAWISSAGSITDRAKEIEVNRGDIAFGRGVQLLDSGPGINPGSLQRHGQQISWLHGNRLRSAPLR